MYITGGKAVEAQVECRYRRKEPCDAATNSSYWCYKSANDDDPMSTLRSSQDLLLLKEQDPTNDTSIPLRRVYMTEGSRMQNNSKFVTSIEVIFDGEYIASTTHASTATQNVTVCSISTVLKAAIIFSMDVKFNAEFVEYLDYYQTRPDGENEPPRRVIYHEHSLDYIHGWVLSPSTPEHIKTTGNVIYPRCNISKPTTNPTLLRFGETFLNDDFNKQMFYDYSENAAVTEVAVGGAFLYIFSCIEPSGSQYSVSSEVLLPDSLMPEPRQLYPQKTSYTIKVYNLGYGFRLSSRTGILGMVVLIAHAVIAVLGSFWQLFWEKKVITAWNTIPDYLALGLGSSIKGDGVENTCAGISGKKTLQRVVAVGETTPEHLEITLVEKKFEKSESRESQPKSVLDRFESKYGCQEDKRRKKEKLE